MAALLASNVLPLGRSVWMILEMIVALRPEERIVAACVLFLSINVEGGKRGSEKAVLFGGLW